MRILITADLHYDITRSRAPAEAIARQACEIGGDAIVLVGDSAGAELDTLRECLKLFDGFPGWRFMVPGNHCLWVRDGSSSFERYEHVLPALAADEGFTMLDNSPVVLTRADGWRVGLAGSVGWYDYSLADESLAIPRPFYEAKVAPGAANYLSEHRDLVAAHIGELTERHLAMGSRWMDGQYVHLGMSDEEFTRLLAGRLAGQFTDLSARTDQVVAFVHHLAFAQTMPKGRPDRFAFASAFMGSRLFGEAALACPKCTHLYCGHSHWADDRMIGPLHVINIGSTYVDKKLLTLEL